MDGCDVFASNCISCVASTVALAIAVLAVVGSTVCWSSQYHMFYLYKRTPFFFFIICLDQIPHSSMGDRLFLTMNNYLSRGFIHTCPWLMSNNMNIYIYTGVGAFSTRFTRIYTYIYTLVAFDWMQSEAGISLNRVVVKYALKSKLGQGRLGCM